MSSLLVPDRWDIGMAIRFCPIDPLLIDSIIAAYKGKTNGITRIGFVGKLKDNYPLGEFAYVVSGTDRVNKIESVRTQYFNNAPIHLYDRAEDWFLNGSVIETINTELGYSKAEAKDGRSASGLYSPDAYAMARPHG